MVLKKPKVTNVQVQAVGRLVPHPEVSFSRLSSALDNCVVVYRVGFNIILLNPNCFATSFRENSFKPLSSIVVEFRSCDRCQEHEFGSKILVSRFPFCFPLIGSHVYFSFHHCNEKPFLINLNDIVNSIERKCMKSAVKICKTEQYAAHFIRYC